MAKRKSLAQKLCAICGDKARGVNFNVATCQSCKAFFRRNALRNKKLICPFNDQCKIDIRTRKFCTKCRLAKCLTSGMKKEWIRTDEENQIMQEIVRKNRLKREREQMQSIESENYEFSFNSVNLDVASSYSPEDSDQTEIDEDNFTVRNNSISTTCSTIISSDDEFPTAEELISSTSVSSSLDFLSSCLDVDYFGKLVDDLFLNEDVDLNEQIELSEKDHTYCKIEVNSNNNNQSNDFIMSCLTGDMNEYETMQNQPIEPFYQEIGLPFDELFEFEKFRVKELTEASQVLKNPYSKITDCTDYSPKNYFRVSWFFMDRLIRMCGQLSAFVSLTIEDQARMINSSLMEMGAIRSVLLYDPDRNSWAAIDDEKQMTVMVRVDIFRQFCTTHSYIRHRQFRNRFRDEWKRDNIIFDLLTAIVLFTPRQDYAQCDRIKEEHVRYCRLLGRYLEIKYRTLSEAELCYRQLMDNVNEMRVLNVDVQNAFKQIHN